MANSGAWPSPCYVSCFADSSVIGPDRADGPGCVSEQRGRAARMAGAFVASTRTTATEPGDGWAVPMDAR